MKFKKLFIDTEVSPNLHYSWRCGSKVNLTHDSIYKERTMLTAAYAFDNEAPIGLTWDAKKESCKSLVKSMIEVMDEADIVIGQNHKSFDIKWLRTMAIKYGLPMRPSYSVIDTLTEYKKYFNFNSNKQDYVSKFLTGDGKLKTDFQLWVNVWIKKDPAALAYMLEYNLKDVIDLRNCYNKIAPYLSAHNHQGVANGNPTWTCPHCGSYKSKIDHHRYSPTGTKSYSMRCKDCGRYYTINEAARKARQLYMYGDK